MLSTYPSQIPSSGSRRLSPQDSSSSPPQHPRAVPAPLQAAAPLPRAPRPFLFLGRASAAVGRVGRGWREIRPLLVLVLLLAGGRGRDGRGAVAPASMST